MTRLYCPRCTNHYDAALAVDVSGEMQVCWPCAREVERMSHLEREMWAEIWQLLDEFWMSAGCLEATK